MNSTSYKSNSGGLAHHIRSTVDGHHLTIHVSGRFDFNCHREFRQAYEGAKGEFTDYVVDLEATEHLDSAALGMLLLLRDWAGTATVRISSCRPAVRKILQIANFGTLFAIS